MEIDKELLQKIIGDTSMSSRDTVAEKYDIGVRAASYYWFVAQNIETLSEFFETDDELVEQNVRYQKQKQKLQDFSRIERKSFREHARVENAVSEYVKELVEVFKNNPYKPKGVAHITSHKAVGVMQLSDIHFNELIDLETNKFDFNVASKRMHKFVIEATTYFKTHGVTDVFVLATGDLMNSDRRWMSLWRWLLTGLRHHSLLLR